MLDVVEEERLVKRAARLGATVAERFRAWRSRFPWIGDVRGLGAMQAMEIVDPVDGRPDTARTRRIQEQALERALLILTAGMHANVLRALMPLTIPDETLSEGLAILEASLAACA